MSRHIPEQFQIRGEPCRPVLKLHRGGVITPESPENSLAALRGAIEWGADMVEIDLRETRDGYALLSHDATFERLCGDSRSVGDLTLAEARNLHVLGTDESLVEFEDVCRLAAGGAIGLALDIKDRTPAVCARVVELLRRYDLQSATIGPGDVPLLWGECFAMFSVAWIGAYRDVRAELPDRVVVGDSVDHLSRGEVDRLHDQGCLCFTVAVGSAQRPLAEDAAAVRGALARCRDAGVDGLIIDTPYFDAAVEILGLLKAARNSLSLRP